MDADVSGTLVTGTSDDLESGNLDVSPLVLTTPVGDELEFRYQRVYERLGGDFEIFEDVVVPEGSYEWDRYVVRAETSDGRPLSLRMTVRWGDFFDGRRLDLVPSLLWRPSKYLLVELTYEHNDVDLDAGDFAVNIASVRVNLQFNPMISWTTLAQYDDVSDQVGINSRLRWIIVPGSDLFVVLNQGLLVDDGNIERGVTEPRVQLGWTFRF